jgi:hypothetical protein
MASDVAHEDIAAEARHGHFSSMAVYALEDKVDEILASSIIGR